MARSRAAEKEAKRAADKIWEREAAATIIDLRRASARERMARSRAKRKEAKRAAEKIRELEATATIIELGWTAGGNGGATILDGGGEGGPPAIPRLVWRSRWTGYGGLDGWCFGLLST